MEEGRANTHVKIQHEKLWIKFEKKENRVAIGRTMNMNFCEFIIDWNKNKGK